MACPICADIRQDYLFVRFGLSYFKCPGCGLIRAEKAGEKSEAFTADSEMAPDTLRVKDQQARTVESDAMRNYLSMLGSRGLKTGSRVLVVAENPDQYSSVGDAMGYAFTGAGSGQSVVRLKSGGKFDAALLVYQLERASHPDAFLKKIHSLLKPEGLLLIAAPSLDSRSARVFGSAWTEWRPENRTFFSEATIQLLLWKSRFIGVEIKDDERLYTMAYINRRAGVLPQTWLTKTAQALYRLFPRPLRKLKLPCLLPA